MSLFEYTSLHTYLWLSMCCRSDLPAKMFAGWFLPSTKHCQRFFFVFLRTNEEIVVDHRHRFHSEAGPMAFSLFKVIKLCCAVVRKPKVITYFQVIFPSFIHNVHKYLHMYIHLLMPSNFLVQEVRTLVALFFWKF